MTIDSEHFMEHWKLCGSDNYGNETYGNITPPNVACEHMSPNNKRSPLSFCITSEDCYKWENNTWVAI